MADGDFTTLVSKDKDANAVANPIFTQLSDGAAALGITSGSLDVNLTGSTGSITVTATDLDIRDLAHASDSVQVWANTAKDGTGTAYVPLVDADGKLIISNPAGTIYTEDVAAPAAADGIANLVQRKDTPATITPADGDWTKQYANDNGSLWVAVDGTVDIGTVSGTVTVTGTVAATQSGVWDIGTVSTVTAVTDITNTVTVDGTVAATQSGVWDIGTVTTITNDVNIADGGNSITVDAVDLDIRSLTHVSDSVQVGDGTDVMAVNTDGSINVNVISGAAESGGYHDYDTGSAIAAGATDTHTVTASGGIMLVNSVIAACSGRMKYEIQNAGSTVAVGFVPGGAGGSTQQLEFEPPIAVADAAALTVIRTNRQNQANDVYTTVVGRQL